MYVHRVHKAARIQPQPAHFLAHRILQALGIRPRVESRTGAVAVVSRWLLTKLSRRRLSPVGLGSVSCCRVGPGISPRASHRSGREPLASSGSCHPKEGCCQPSRQAVPPVSRGLDPDEGDLPPSLHGNFPASSLPRSSAPLASASVLSASWVLTCAFPLASPARFSTSVRKPVLESRLLCTGTPHGQYVGNRHAVPGASG